MRKSFSAWCTTNGQQFIDFKLPNIWLVYHIKMMHKFGWTFWISECGTHITAYVTLIAPSNIFRFPPEQLKDAFGWGILCVFVNVVTFYFYSGVCNVLNITFKHLLWTLAQTKQIYIYIHFIPFRLKNISQHGYLISTVCFWVRLWLWLWLCVYTYIFSICFYTIYARNDLT